MKVAITGASGFIGKLLVDRHIQLGDEVNALSRNEIKHRLFNDKVKFFKGDLLDKESLSKFVENVDIFNVNINHGEGGTARTKMKKELQSQIQGHLHSDFYIDYIVGKNFRIFGMQIGCGVDHYSYAMAYGKNFKKPAIGCGVLLNKGKLPIIIPMIL